MRIRRAPCWGVLLVTAVLAAGCGAPSKQGHTMTMAKAALAEGTVRQYFIAADKVDWDYAPAGKNLITGEDFGDEENIFVGQGDDRIGRVYEKSLYREYTDATFKDLKPRTAADEHLGYMGPTIHAVVGDKIEVTFKNNTEFPASVHAHGVLYSKDSEGAPYADGTAAGDKHDDAVAPGDTHVYQWSVPERAGPGPHDPNSIMWMYHSHVDEVADVYAGMMGAIVVTRAGMAREDGRPNDVDREFIINFEVTDENSSPYLESNIDKYATKPGTVDPEDEDFGESNLMHSMDGYVYGNQPGLTIKQGEKVRWYLMGMGTEVDLHTPHWHGNVVTAMGMRTDVVSLLPAQMVVADMQADSPGTWLLHCHVADHISAGMQGLFKVE